MSEQNTVPSNHNHPFAKNYIFGVRIKTGTILEATDVYASTSGQWEPCPCPGLEMNNPDVIWIRPAR